MISARLQQLAGSGLAILIGLVAATAQAQEKTSSPEAIRFFESKVRPLLADQCFKCHGADKQRGHLRADSRSALLQGGDLGPAIVPGDAEKSLLIKAVRHADPDFKMPPSSKLSREQIDDLAKWIALGAPWPGSDNNVKVVKKAEKEVTDKDRQHWAFQPIKRPALPAVKNEAWAANPIDAFIAARLEAKSLAPNPAASKTELIRRLTYNLTGLPPTPQDVNDFIKNTSPRAYEDLVNKLLASPRFGEKWARHWLDIVRYAETNSYERDNPKPHVWRYRDYVIRAMNDDKPFDVFLREQIAGDEMPQAGPDQFIATGFYRLGVWDDEPTDRLQARYDGLDDIVATVGQGILGLTIDCARCHDHKIDPIPQKDYYKLLSFFHNINHFRNGGPTDEMPLNADKNAEKALIVSEAGPAAPATFVLMRGNPGAQGAKVEPGFPLALTTAAPKIPEPAKGAKSTGRRSVLADWLTSRDNALTARVIVNRLWQHHFGRGIVRSTNNFGVQGDRPTHPELLDYLASELIDNGWSLKHIHRLITQSNAYKMSSRGQPDALKIDPANDLFWRFDMRRLSAEEVRDSILAVSGNLNLKMQGPGVYPEIPREVLAGQSAPGRGWGKSTPEEQARRSVYVHVKRSLIVPILESFDVAETDRSAPTRFSSTQPTQALLMLNSAFIGKQAEIFAERLRREAGNDIDGQVRLGLNLATSREPTQAEVRRGVDLINILARENGANSATALHYFCLMALNLNEFMYLD
jgi:mono/diheme cytochrome c family protein